MMGNAPGTRLHFIWVGMRRRCLTPSHQAYRFYGARGIHVCEEWDTFVGFLDWALCSDYAFDKQIDRIDADGPYSPRNCRWVSQEINVKRRELDREGTYLADLSGELTNDVVADALAREKPYKLNDGNGLYLRVSPSGSKSWRYRFRFEGKDQLLVLGRFPRMPLVDARELHAVARAQVNRGRNPTDIKRDRRARRERG